MKSSATPRLWAVYRKLPTDVQGLASKAYRLFAGNPRTKAPASRRCTATSRFTQFASPLDTGRLVSSRVTTLHGSGSEPTPTTTDSSQDSDEAPRQPSGPAMGCRPGDGSCLLTVGRRKSQTRPGTRFTGSVIRVALVGVVRRRIGAEDSVSGTGAAAAVAPIGAGCSPSSTPCSADGSEISFELATNTAHHPRPLRCAPIACSVGLSQPNSQRHSLQGQSVRLPARASRTRLRKSPHTRHCLDARPSRMFPGPWTHEVPCQCRR